MRGEHIAEIKRHRLEVIPQTGFMKRANGARREPCGDEQNKEAGPAEKRAEVKTNAAPVEQETKHHGGRKPKHRAERRPDAHILTKCGQQEEDRFEALARDREKHHHHQRPAVSARAFQRAIHGLFQLAFHIAGHFTHPEHHPGEDHDGNGRHQPFKQLLLFLRELAGGFIDENAKAQAERGGEKYACPHHAKPVTALGALEIAGDKADDKRRFKTFTQHNQKRNKHSGTCKCEIRSTDAKKSKWE
ncbi:hypothetical protein BN132_3897 [Cronobacter turicensis 564]|nr:hypothetical protein BN132_3897 [Cronobacter turicensis 564]